MKLTRLRGAREAFAGGVLDAAYPPALFAGVSAPEVPLSGDICRLRSARSLRPYVRRAQECGRSPARLRGRRRRSRGSRAQCRDRSGGLDYRATTAQWHADPAVRRAETLEAGGQPGAAHVCAGSVGRRGRHAKGTPLSGLRYLGKVVDRTSARSAMRSAWRLGADYSAPTALSFPTMRCCALPRSIYQSLSVQGRGGLRRELTACLRTGPALRVTGAHPRSSQLASCRTIMRPRIVAAHRVLPRAVDLVTTMAAAQIVPNAVFDWSSQHLPSRCCDDQLSSPSTRRWRSASAARRPAFGPPWDRSATPTTTPCARASSQRSSANCWIAVVLRHWPRRASRASASSRDSITPCGCTPPWATIADRLRNRRPHGHDRTVISQALDHSTKPGQLHCALPPRRRALLRAGWCARRRCHRSPPRQRSRRPCARS